MSAELHTAAAAQADSVTSQRRGRTPSPRWEAPTSRTPRGAPAGATGRLDPGHRSDCCRRKVAAHDTAASAVVDAAAVCHRVGEPAVGEWAPAVAVSAARSREAFVAASEVVGQPKHRLSVWKRRVSSTDRTSGSPVPHGVAPSPVLTSPFGRSSRDVINLVDERAIGKRCDLPWIPSGVRRKR